MTVRDPFSVWDDELSNSIVEMGCFSTPSCSVTRYMRTHFHPKSAGSSISMLPVSSSGTSSVQSRCTEMDLMPWMASPSSHVASFTSRTCHSLE